MVPVTRLFCTKWREEASQVHRSDAIQRRYISSNRRTGMRLRNISVLAAATAIAFILMPPVSRAELLLETGTATTSSTVRDPGSIGFGQGVSDATTASLTQFAMFLEAPTGGNVKYMIWNGTNSSLLCRTSCRLLHPTRRNGFCPIRCHSHLTAETPTTLEPSRTPTPRLSRLSFFHPPA